MIVRHRMAWLFLLLVVFGSLARGQTTIAAATQPAADPTLDDLMRLRDSLKDAYNQGDVDRMLTFLHPEVLIIFPDAEVLTGREALRAYYQKMLKGPDPVVRRYTADPVVDGRQIRGDVDLSWGRMNDHYVLSDGTEFGLDSRFTATLLKSPNGPAESGGWIIRSFHSSTDAFDNPVLKIAAKRVALYAGSGALVVGLLIGILAGWLMRRTRPTNPSTPSHP